jgi:hypothetical protein
MHVLRYLDPGTNGMVARRIKEVWYLVKEEIKSDEQMRTWHTRERNEVDAPPRFSGSVTGGFRNGKGWALTAFIEDGGGRLRLQAAEEQYYCMGCHRSVGVTVDDTFSFARKLPGTAGWRVQSLANQQDVPLKAKHEGEFSEYMRRTAGGNEFRSNAEMLQRFFLRGAIRTSLVERAAVGGDRDLEWLLMPSRERALALNSAYIRLVRLQKFEKGRDIVLDTPPRTL